MTILYESAEDRKRVQTLHNKQHKHSFGILLSANVLGLGLGFLINGSLKNNEVTKNVGLITTVGAVSSFIYNYREYIKLNKILEKPENANVVLHSTPMSGFKKKIYDAAKSIGLLSPPLQGKSLAPGTEIVQGRKKWEERIAEQKSSPENNLPSVGKQ